MAAVQGPARDNRRPMHSSSRAGSVALLLAAATVLAACSLTFNWREVPVGDAGLVALLPCKPDRGSRALPLGDQSVHVDIVGCEAGGATFAVAHARASDVAQAAAWLDAWQAATRTQLAGSTITAATASLPRAALTPAAVRLDARRADQAGGAAVQVLWFAQWRAGGVSVYQATVLGVPDRAEAAGVFFDGLRLP